MVNLIKSMVSATILKKNNILVKKSSISGTTSEGYIAWMNNYLAWMIAYMLLPEKSFVPLESFFRIIYVQFKKIWSFFKTQIII